MYGTFYAREEMVGVSDIERATDSRSPKADAVKNLLTIAKEMNEVEIFLSAARSYVNTSKTVLQNLKRYSCIAEADILSAAECITKSEMRLQRMNLELQTLFQNIFYQEFGHCNRYASNERKEHSNRTTISMSEHVLDTIKRYAKDKSIDLSSCTATYDEYDGATFVILHPNSIHSKNSLSSHISHRRNISESSASDSGNAVNRENTTSNSKSIPEKFEGIVFNNPQWEASCQQQPHVRTESLARKSAYNSKTSSEIHQPENEDSSLPVNELRQHSSQTEACNICPNLTERMSETSSSYQHNQGKCSTIINFPLKSRQSSTIINFPLKSRQSSDEILDSDHIFFMSKNAKHFTQIGSKRNAANAVTSTKVTEFHESEKTDVNKISGRKLDVTQTERTRVGHSRNPDSFYPVKKSEMTKDVNGNTVSFVTQSDADLTKASNSSDFIRNKDNESGSGSDSHGSSSRETVFTFPLQSRLATHVSFQNTSETRSQFFQTGSRKATFCNRRAISLTEDSTGKLFVADKARMDKCDRRNNADVVTFKRFPPDTTLDAAIALKDENESNASINATLNVASNNSSKTTVPSNFNLEHIDFTNRSDISYFNDNMLTSTNNTLRSLTIHGKPYSSSQKEVSNKRSFKFLKEIAAIKKSESRNSVGGQTSPEENTNRSQRANFCETEQQLNSKMQFLVVAVPGGNNSRKSSKSSEYFTYKELFEQDNKNMLLVDKYSDLSVSETIASDNPSLKVQLDSFDASSELRDPNYGSACKCASDMNYVKISPETGESERFENVSSIVCSDSSTATNRSCLSQSPRSSVQLFGDRCFGLFHSQGGAGLLAENSLNVNASFTNTGCSLENNFERLQDSSYSCLSSSNPSSRTSVLPLVSSFRESPTPTDLSSSSVENSP